VKKKLIVALAASLAAVVVALPIGRASALETPKATGPMVATFNVAGERFKVKFTKAADIALARKVLAGKAAPVPFPIGTIVYGSPDVNTGYTWHLDSVAWTEQAMEVCDGRPRSDVETRKLTSPYYCPWGAKLVALAPVPTVTPVVATFDVAGERFKVKFTKAADIALARKVLAGKAAPVPFPIGTIVYGSPDVNTGYTWHLDSVAWTEQAMEVCDGRPRSDVETRQVTSPYYCPWGAKLISLK
jgi:hypothetical protein